MKKKSVIVSSSAVKSRRSLRSWSQGDLSMEAAALGFKITVNVLQKIETGRAKEIDLTTLFGLSFSLECDPKDLVDVIEVG